MEFFEARSKCAEQVSATLNAICLNEQQKVVAFKVVNLLLDSKLASLAGDETAEKLLFSSALVLESETFGEAAKAKWVLLNQIVNLISKCVDEFDSESRGQIATVYEEGFDDASLIGIINQFVRKTRPHRFANYESLKEKCEVRLASLRREIRFLQVRESIASFFYGSWLVTLGVAAFVKMLAGVSWGMFFLIWLLGGFLSIIVAVMIFETGSKDEMRLRALKEDCARIMKELRGES